MQQKYQHMLMNTLQLVYIHNKLLHVSADHVSIVREVNTKL